MNEMKHVGIKLVLWIEKMNICCRDLKFGIVVDSIAPLTSKYFLVDGI